MTRFGLTALVLASTALTAPALAAAAVVLPTGGKVVAGQATIGAPSGGTLSITQSSSKAILDWRGFSIGQGGAVVFNNGSGATLNRVTGAQVSSLDGLLTGTGSVYLINPNGVIVGRSGVVNVGGTFVASTLDTSNSGFLSGGALSFAGPSTAAVVNYGKVGSLGGDVALIATRVSNAGQITAANGDAGLLAGSRVLLKDASLDEGRFSVLLGGAGTSVTNSGLIAAADAELRAEGGNVYALAGDTTGVIRATGVSIGGGHVWLVAEGGTLDVAGVLQAQALGGASGTIETSGRSVGLDQARIDAHGGTWLVDPDDLTIDVAAASTIDGALNAGTSVTEQTTATGTSGSGVVNAAGAGDIIVASPLVWSTTAALTLSAYHSIDVDAAITASGGGALNLVTDNSGVGNGGTLSFKGAAVQFTGGTPLAPTGMLAIGVGTTAPLTYTLVGSLAALAADVAVNNAGAYALATSVDGSNGGAGYVTSPLVSTIATPFAGVIEGLGNSVTNLTITDRASGFVGLVAQNAGTVGDIVLSGGSVTGAGAVGALVGHNAPAGLVSGASASANVSAQASGASLVSVGGLVGSNDGTVQASSASGTVTDTDTAVATTAGAGGLVGVNTGTVTGSSASGAITSLTDPDAGGLIGSATAGTISADSASGAVIGTVQVGGLVGVSAAPISASSASGNVQGAEFAGGLVGALIANVTGSSASGNVDATVANAGGLIGLAGVIFTQNSSISPGGTSQSFSQGVAGASAIEASFATGKVTGQNFVGGLIGFTSSASTTLYVSIDQSYATGAVQAVANPAVTGSGSGAGGLIGAMGGASVTSSYATGAVSGDANVGGLVGDEGIGITPNPDGSATITTSSISKSYATGAVTATGDFVGGLVGAVFGQTVADSYATGDVQGGDYVGGLVGGAEFQNTRYGQSFTPSIMGTNFQQTTYATGAVTGLDNGEGKADIVGGLVGENEGVINNAFYRNAEGGTGVSGRYYIGGLVGLNDAFGEPTNADVITLGYVSGAVSGSFYVGGVVGDNFGTVSNSTFGGGFSTPVTGQGMVGGVVGVNEEGASVDSSQAYGAVMGSSYVGGVAGDNFGSLTNVTMEGTVSGGGGTGGIVGVNETDGTIDGAAVGDPSDTAVVTGTSDNVGGIAGANFGAIGQSSTVTANADVSGQDNVGGLVGYNSGPLNGAEGSLEFSVFGIRTVTGTNYVGGLVGLNWSRVVGSSAATVNGAQYVGGLVGWNTSYGAVSDGMSMGDVTATGSYVGGLAGVNEGAVSNSSASGAVSGAGLVGGLVGLNRGGVQYSSASGTVSGDLYLGGLVGWNDTGALLQTSYETGAVTGTAGGQDALGNDYVGGLVGVNYGQIANAYATGAVSGVKVVGGLVGANMPGGTSGGATYPGGQVTDAYSTGAVGASSGAAGTSFGVQAGEVTNVYGFAALSGQPLESGYVGATATGDGTGLSTSQEAGSAAYVGFDFTNVWQSNPDGPPTLLGPPSF